MLYNSGGAAPDDHLVADAAPHLAAVQGQQAEHLRAAGRIYIICAGYGPAG